MYGVWDMEVWVYGVLDCAGSLSVEYVTSQISEVTGKRKEVCVRYFTSTLSLSLSLSRISDVPTLGLFRGGSWQA